MASMTIRNIDEQLKRRLRMRAGLHGRSMEEEARDILRTTLSAEPSQVRSLVDSVRARFEPLDGVELEIAPCEPMREPVNLERDIRSGRHVGALPEELTQALFANAGHGVNVADEIDGEVAL